jgi:hypothetical protein
MLDLETKEKILPTIEDLAPEAQIELAEDVFFQKSYRTTRQGQLDIWKISLKGKLQATKNGTS